MLKRLKTTIDRRRRNIRIARGSYVSPKAVIGHGTKINAASHIEPCTIGAYCAIGGRLVVRNRNHATGYMNMQGWAQKHVIGSDVQVSGLSSDKVNIGNAVWIGDSVIILHGVRIGNGAVIGAGSVVTKSVPDYAIYAGNPARMIRPRFDEAKIELIRDIAWWDWPVDRIARNRPFFELDIGACSMAELRDAIAALT